MTPTEYQQLVEFLGQRFAEVDRRFIEMDGGVAGTRQDLADLRREMLGHFDEVYRRLERLEQEYQAITRPCVGSRRGWPTSVGAARSSSATSPS